LHIQHTINKKETNGIISNNVRLIKRHDTKTYGSMEVVFHAIITPLPESYLRLHSDQTGNQVSPRDGLEMVENTEIFNPGGNQSKIPVI
jgi:hypothetical protein